METKNYDVVGNFVKVDGLTCVISSAESRGNDSLHVHLITCNGVKITELMSISDPFPAARPTAETRDFLKTVQKFVRTRARLESQTQEITDTIKVAVKEQRSNSGVLDSHQIDCVFKQELNKAISLAVGAETNFDVNSYSNRNGISLNIYYNDYLEKWDANNYCFVREEYDGHLYIDVDEHTQKAYDDFVNNAGYKYRNHKFSVMIDGETKVTGHNLIIGDKRGFEYSFGLSLFLKKKSNQSFDNMTEGDIKTLVSKIKFKKA